MNTNRQTAVIVGVLFIFATVSSILGLLFYQPMLAGPDYLINGAASKNQVLLGVLMELILVCSAIGTAIGLFPILDMVSQDGFLLDSLKPVAGETRHEYGFLFLFLAAKPPKKERETMFRATGPTLNCKVSTNLVLRKYNESIVLAHLCFRFLEAVIITIGIVAVLSLVTLSQDFVAAVAPDASAYHAAGTLLRAVHDWTFMLGPLFMLGVNTLMYSYLLYTSRLVPRPLAVLGLSGATLVLGNALLVMFGVVPQLSVWAILTLPVAAYEMLLAVWLIVKGFNPAAIASAPAQTGTNELLSAA